MPGPIKGRAYGPYHMLAVTPSNAEVRLVDPLVIILSLYH